MAMSGRYDLSFVVLSFLIAAFASFTALSLASRIRACDDGTRRIWIAAAAIALGGGIWSMHFIAMLAFTVPGVAVSYGLSLTVLSLGVAIMFTAGGFATIEGEHNSLARSALGGLLMGSGILAMHYIGMAAMQMPVTLVYRWPWVALSALIAIGAASAALWLAARDHKLPYQLLAAGVMGLAISGMHYAGMHAAAFVARKAQPPVVGAASLDRTYIALLIGGVTILILMLALGAARIERVMRDHVRREQRFALLLQISDILRGRDTQTVLEELAAFLGSHFAVDRTGCAQLDPDADLFDYEVCWTNGTVPPLLGRYPAAAFGVKIVEALTAGRTVVVDDLFGSQLSDEDRTHQTAREVDTRAILVVPFVREGRLHTIVYLNERRVRHWTREEVVLLEEVADRTRHLFERAAVEDELRHLNATLEERIEERTKELRDAQDALLQSQKMEAMGQLVSGMAHDFNNVLGAVTGAFDLIAGRPGESERVARFAAAGLEAAQRGAKLTGQLLSFSRAQRIEPRPIYVCDVIEEVRDMLERSLGPMISLEFALNPSPVPVLADPTQVEMAVLNLAINARDAMPNGGALRIETKVVAVCDDHELSPGPYVEIAVSDTGSGMDEETLRRATEPFFTTKPVGKGTGLGLSQIYGSAKQAGGAVRIESKVGAGTIVRVLLPCTDRRPSTGLSSTREATPTTGSGGKVLLVDDDADMRAIFSEALEIYGFQVMAAPDGESALKALEREIPEVAVLDYAMPGMNGAILAREIKERFPSVHILIASGFADTAAIDAVLGPDRPMLHKPFLVDDLVAAVRTAMAKQAVA